MCKDKKIYLHRTEILKKTCIFAQKLKKYSKIWKQKKISP